MFDLLEVGRKNGAISCFKGGQSRCLESMTDQIKTALVPDGEFFVCVGCEKSFGSETDEAEERRELTEGA